METTPDSTPEPIDIALPPTLATVAVHGDVDMANAAAFEAQLVDAAGRAGEVHVDLSDVAFFDSTAIRALLVGAAAAEARGHRLRVVALSEPVRRVLEISGLLAHLGVEGA